MPLHSNILHLTSAVHVTKIGCYLRNQKSVKTRPNCQECRRFPLALVVQIPVTRYVPLKSPACSCVSITLPDRDCLGLVHQADLAPDHCDGDDYADNEYD
jgi:hypothetical protein